MTNEIMPFLPAMGLMLIFALLALLLVIRSGNKQRNSTCLLKKRD